MVRPSYQDRQKNRSRLYILGPSTQSLYPAHIVYSASWPVHPITILICENIVQSVSHPTQHSPLLVVCRYTDRGCLPTLVALPVNLCITSSVSFPNAPHDLLCSLNGNSLINLYSSSVTPGIMAYPDEPGDTTWASCMYLQAVVGFFQSVFCIVVNRSSPANARETAPPDLNECIEKSPCTPVATALCSRSTAIRLAESGSGPRRCTSPSYRNSKHVHLYECCNCINKLIESTAADVYCGYPSVRLVLLSLPLTRPLSIDCKFGFGTVSVGCAGSIFQPLPRARYVFFFLRYLNTQHTKTAEGFISNHGQLSNTKHARYILSWSNTAPYIMPANIRYMRGVYIYIHTCFG